MAITTEDARTLLHLLEEPPLRAQLRWLVATEELQALSDQIERLTGAVGQLAEAQQRTEERLDRLAEAQQRTEERLERLAEAQRRTEERLERLEATVQALAEAQRRTEERLERLEATVQALAEAQRRTEERLERLEATVQALAEAQQRTEERLERLEATVQALAEAQQRTEASLKELTVEMRHLADWQQGETGLREGERYARLILKRAPLLFMAGEGGFTDQPSVQQHLSRLLKSLPDMTLLTDDENPLLADLVWWKGEQVLIVEISRQVNGHDVVRAARRAETLRRAGVQAVGVVIGEEWASAESRQQAETRAVQWKVGSDLSEGFLAFRRLAA